MNFVKERNISEKIALFLGYFVGVVTFIISFIRGARAFHPNGTLFEAEVVSNAFHPHALLRLSSGWWKNKEWPDLLGVAIRFTPSTLKGIVPLENDQDLLFISKPGATDQHNYLKNTYYAGLDFISDGKIRRYKLEPKKYLTLHGNRQENIIEAVLEGEAIFILQEKLEGQNNWQEIAQLKLIRTLHYDQEALRFNPFQNGLNIRPIGFIQYLRFGAYQMSQWGRPGSENP